MNARGVVGCVLLVGCAGRAGEVEPVMGSDAPVVYERGRHAMCAGFDARPVPAEFERGEALLRQARTDYDEGRESAAAHGYLAAAAEFRAARDRQPGLAVAGTNMRIAFADAALAWLTEGRVEEARAALVEARTVDEAMQARWQRAIDELPRAPSCAFDTR